MMPGTYQICSSKNKHLVFFGTPVIRKCKMQMLSEHKSSGRHGFNGGLSLTTLQPQHDAQES